MNENCLTEMTSRLLPDFSRFDYFYLVGGTALALQIGHRISVDFYFLRDPVDRKTVESTLNEAVKSVGI